MRCRTAEEAYEAGARKAAEAPPLTAGQVTAIALILTPYRTTAKAA